MIFRLTSSRNTGLNGGWAPKISLLLTVDGAQYTQMVALLTPTNLSLLTIPLCFYKPMCYLTSWCISTFLLDVCPPAQGECGLSLFPSLPSSRLCICSSLVLSL